jgi:hypothetical protein
VVVISYELKGRTVEGWDGHLLIYERTFSDQWVAESVMRRLQRQQNPHRGIGTSSLTLGIADLAYGGPEEGGWYYDTFQQVRTFTFPARYHERAHHWLERYCRIQNQGRPEISSVLSEGRYVVRGGIASHEPKTRPRYS